MNFDKQLHILVVDDDMNIREALTDHLNMHGFEAHGIENAALARQYLEEKTVDLVVLDIMMPGEDGLSLCRFISENMEIPVILLTALAEDTDRIVGLEIGADDYVTKPFNPRELIARIRSVLRRSQGARKQAAPKVMKFGIWEYQLSQMQLVKEGGVVVPLSTGEQRLLRALLENAGTTVSRDDLFTLIKGRDPHPFERSLDNMLSRLRKKIEPDPANPRYIKTVWGGGYCFNESVTFL